MKKLMILSVLLAGSPAQAALDWGGSAAIFGPAGDSSWTNPNSWRDQVDALPGIPVAGDTLFIQRYAWGNEGVPGGGWDTGAVGPTLDTTIAGLADVYLATQDTVPIVGGQIAELNLVSGADLSANNLLMGRVANSTATLNMSGDATASFGGFFLPIDGTASATINMNDSADLTINALAGTTFWSIVMDADAVLTINNAPPGWENLNITAKNAGDSIQATNLGGAAYEYVVIPEPATIGLLSMAGGALVLLRKRYMI